MELNSGNIEPKALAKLANTYIPIIDPVNNSNRERYIQLAEMAINKFNEDEGEKYAFRTIENVVGKKFSLDYYITFKADDGKGGTKTFQTIAFSSHNNAGVDSVVMKKPA